MLQVLELVSSVFSIPSTPNRAAMETRASRRRKLLLKEAVGDSEDRISNLPDAILHHILSFLPVKSIAQTSLLSTRWRYLWASYPCLDFYEKTCRRQTYYKAMEFINAVLARRHANSNIKVFRFKGELGFTCLRDCIRRLVRHRVEELKMNVSFVGGFNLPRCVFDCDSLTSLSLKSHHPFGYSWFKLLRSSDTSGLRSLQALTLKYVHFVNSDSAALFSGSSSFPALKRLTLKRCEGLNRLNIGCQRIEDLEVEWTVINVLDVSTGERLKNLRVKSSFRACKNESWVKIFAPKLETFCWEGNEIPEKNSVQSFPFLKNCSIDITERYLFIVNAAINFLSGAVSARYLRIRTPHTGESFSTIYLEGGLPFPFLNLRTLEVHNGLRKSEIPGIVCLLKNAPLLDTLKLEFVHCDVCMLTRRLDDKWGITLLDDSGFTEEQFWESEAQALRSILDHLRVLKIYGMSKSAIIATRFLLKHGNVLQEVTLISSKHQYEWEENDIIGFPRASPHIKINLMNE